MGLINISKKGRVIVRPIICALILAFPILGNADFTPSAGVTYSNDDNIFRQEGSKTSDDISTISLGLGAEWLLGKHSLSAQYGGEFAYYDKNTNEDYKDHSLGASLLLDLTPKFNLDLNANTRRGHESRGSSGVASGVTAIPNKTEDNHLFAGLSYGRRSAKAQIQLEFDAGELHYTNNNQQGRDRDTDSLTGRVFYNIGPKTALIFEALNRDVDYLNPGSRNRNSTERYYNLGLSWEATYKTTGEVKIGRFTKKFESASEANGSGGSVAASIVWAPKTYSQVTFGASRQASETSTTDSFIINSVVSADWEHAFNPRLRFSANISDGKDDYSGSREDNLSNRGMGLKYRFRPWLDIGLSYSYAERKSNEADSSFEDNIYMLSLTI